MDRLMREVTSGEHASSTCGNLLHSLRFHLRHFPVHTAPPAHYPVPQSFTSSGAPSWTAARSSPVPPHSPLHPHSTPRPRRKSRSASASSAAAGTASWTCARLIQVANVEVVSLCDVDKKMLAEAADLVAERQKREEAADLHRLQGDAEGEGSRHRRGRHAGPLARPADDRGSRGRRPMSTCRSRSAWT